MLVVNLIICYLITSTIISLQPPNHLVIIQITCFNLFCFFIITVIKIFSFFFFLSFDFLIDYKINPEFKFSDKVFFSLQECILVILFQSILST